MGFVLFASPLWFPSPDDHAAWQFTPFFRKLPFRWRSLAPLYTSSLGLSRMGPSPLLLTYCWGLHYSWPLLGRSTCSPRRQVMLDSYSSQKSEMACPPDVERIAPSNDEHSAGAHSSLNLVKARSVPAHSIPRSPRLNCICQKGWYVLSGTDEDGIAKILEKDDERDRLHWGVAE